jgi:hypothetical protein
MLDLIAKDVNDLLCEMDRLSAVSTVSEPTVQKSAHGATADQSRKNCNPLGQSHKS